MSGRLISFGDLDVIGKRATDPKATPAALRADIRTLIAACYELRARLTAAHMAVRGELTGTHAEGIVIAAIESERVRG